MIHKLEADSIQLEFKGRSILTDVYIKSETKKITGLLGRNGQGKTCLMNIIFGSLKCQKSIRFDNKCSNEAFRIPGLIQYLPQFNFIPKSLSIKRIFKDFQLDFSTFEKRFPEFSLRYKSTIASLSGGEQRLLEIYVIVKSKSLFTLLDEPFTHLSPIQIEKIKELLLEEKETKGLLITDHLYHHIIDICDNLYVLVNGRTYLSKSLEEIEALGYARF